MPTEQDLFTRLAVFAGGCTLEAAEEICGADVDAITSLVDKSLLRRTGDRYWMLETIREFAAERLDELADSRLLRDRHAAWYTALGERARPELRAWGAREWLGRLDAEHANLRAALECLLESGEADGALRLSGAIWPYWQTRGHWTEGRRYLNAAVALGADLEPERLVDALWGASLLAQWQGDIDEGEQLASRMLEISKRAVEQEHVYSVAIHLLAIVATKRDDRDRALALLEESLAIVRRGGEPWLLSIALNNLGNLLMREGDYERAAGLFEESLAIGEARGDVDRRARAQQPRLGDSRPRRPPARPRLLPPRPGGRDRDRARRRPALGAVRHRRLGIRGGRRPRRSSSARPNEGTRVATRR
jgi:non-specific serine/threonine protein kinase